MKATIIADASFCPDTKLGGWAVWIRYDDKKLVRLSGRFKNRLENSYVAEKYAALNGISLCVKRANQQLTKILVQTDCLDVVKFLTQAEIASHLVGLELPEIKVVHVRGHVSNSTEPKHFCQNWCDREARQRMREARKA